MDAGAAPVVYADAAPCTFVLPDGEHRVVVHCPADHSTLAVSALQRVPRVKAVALMC